MRIKNKVLEKESASFEQLQLCRSSIIKEIECARHENESSNMHRFECFILAVWIVSLADWYLAILTTFITEKGQFQ